MRVGIRSGCGAGWGRETYGNQARHLGLQRRLDCVLFRVRDDPNVL